MKPRFFLLVVFSALSSVATSQVNNALLTGRETEPLKIDSEKIQLDSALTVAFWSYHDEWNKVEGEQCMISNLEYGGFSVCIAGYEIVATVMRDTYRSIYYSTRNLLPGWHHFAITYNSRHLKLYTDGILRSEQRFENPVAFIAPNRGIPLLLGADPGNLGKPRPNSFFTGMLDDLLLFDAVLQEEEIRRLKSGSFMSSAIVGFNFDSCTETACNSSQGTMMQASGKPVLAKVVIHNELSRLGEAPWLQLIAITLFVAMFGSSVFASSGTSLGRLLVSVILFLLLLVSVLKSELTLSQWVTPFWNKLEVSLIGSAAYGFFLSLLSMQTTAHKKVFQWMGIALVFSSLLALGLPHSYLPFVWIGGLLIANAAVVLWLTEEKKNGLRVLIALCLLSIALLDATWLYFLLRGSGFDSLIPYGYTLPNLLLGLSALVLMRQLKPFGNSREVLSAREKEVARLMRDGISDKEISERLFVSFNTVRTHSRKIYGKLGVSKRIDAIKKLKSMDLD